jgi:hypothetical protein
MALAYHNYQLQAVKRVPHSFLLRREICWAPMNGCRNRQEPRSLLRIFGGLGQAM